MSYYNTRQQAALQHQQQQQLLLQQQQQHLIQQDENAGLQVRKTATINNSWQLPQQANNNRRALQELNGNRAPAMATRSIPTATVNNVTRNRANVVPQQHQQQPIHHHFQQHVYNDNDDLEDTTEEYVDEDEPSDEEFTDDNIEEDEDIMDIDENNNNNVDMTDSVQQQQQQLHNQILQIGIDEEDKEGIHEYATEIFCHLKSAERKSLAPEHYMEVRQTDINPSMRAILIDWLNEVAQEYGLKPETLYLSVNYADRFLSMVPVVRHKLQLVGVSCMLIAAKYAEIIPPTVDDFVYITDNTYTRDMVLQMESQILNKLGFRLTVVTVHDFLPRYLKAAGADGIVVQLANYLAELTLQEYQFVSYLPSMIAASAVVLAMHTMHQPSWTPTLQYYTGFEGPELSACLRAMLHVFQTAPRNNLQAVREKYSHSNFLRASTIAAPASLPSLFLGM